MRISIDYLFLIEFAAARPSAQHLDLMCSLFAKRRSLENIVIMLMMLLHLCEHKRFTLRTAQEQHRRSTETQQLNICFMMTFHSSVMLDNDHCHWCSQQQ